ncbi:N-terminal nucleophile aminohydrolase [Coniochaeta ligniaria NRRL 30616]|uniref:N-terminal nucleophile aminohydrolase n=1 Tax=Coniochaeta ligniaria NRRL 30616 TaxID=1408157 RepID=A0A1J7JBV5_9PEZI|nr:N-terminal nucleophile aminohydrolase [Coniochaeta ligniaria NRRL 30616]
MRRGSVRRPVAAIFIHAGAGYHSTTNEKIHLEACNDAARLAMRYLKAGADATVAVEAAIKCLEDKEITNAGFGSNLSIDGVVEGDATIVDYLGRSGACGAVPGIRNPISLAKLILDASSRKLSLRRVPPNILVGSGAQLFAEEHGMAAVLNEDLVSRNAKDRFERWFDDLKRADAKAAAAQSSLCQNPHAQRTPTPSEYEAINVPKRDHQAAILNATWNEGQTDSPYHSTTTSQIPSAQASAASSANATPLLAPTQQPLRSPLNFIPALNGARAMASKRPRPVDTTDITAGLSAPLPSSPASKRHRPTEVSAHDSPATDASPSPSTHAKPASPIPTPPILPDTPQAFDPDYASYAAHKREDRDLITDTVGAIAIDLHGRIAAGSSSGGIGMKHRGRVGPAALVGVGTAVIPVDPEDEDAVAVAAVTSGTGEHMATTMASYKCAERLYHSTRRGAGGRDVDEDDEDAVMESFVTADFMGHPGVRYQPSAGAIGVMAVKKSRRGYYFYFAHNTDSFALASMSSGERVPVCTMSRTPESNSVIRGGRKIRVE